MKYYETSFEDYINAIDLYNLHTEINPPKEKLNIIFYGPCGSGKYSQVLNYIRDFSNTNLKYEKKITVYTEKQSYNFHISDIHYEIDMSLLGCYSKMLWHEIFYQIIDIISIKNDKFGFIVCKNFHYIHNELLEIFYSYIQQYSNINSLIKINFIIITENISFIPNNILNSFHIVNIKRPEQSEYRKISIKNKPLSNFIINNGNDKLYDFKKQINNLNNNNITNFDSILNKINMSEITNAKELKSFYNINNNNIPADIFNIICDNIIKELKNVSFLKLRESIYEIFIYNLDSAECIWYILYYFIDNNYINYDDISDILNKCNEILLYFNNNYRPIYHIENILLYIADKIEI